MSVLHIDDVCVKGQVYPMIINFQNGYTTNQLKTLNCEVFEDDKSDTKTVATELENILYAGSELKEDLGKTMILARNKNTGKVRLIEVGCLELKPIINLSDEPLDPQQTSILELSRKFGSKKQKQRMEQREKLRVNVDTVAQQMQNVTENISEDKLDLSSYNKSNSDDFYIPLIDRSANTVEDVYDINKILSEQQFEKIHSELDGKDYLSELHPCIKNIVQSRTCSAEQIVLAVYANSLLKLYTTIVREISKKSFVACPYSASLNEIILSNFTTMANGKRNRPTPYKDKALCHSIVFLLLINNFKFELESLCQNLKITTNTAAMKVRVTGATIVTTGDKKIAQLKLPLNTKSSFRRKSAKF